MLFTAVCTVLKKISRLFYVQQVSYVLLSLTSHTEGFLRVFHMPCCYVPAVVRSLNGDQEIQETGGLSKHSLSPRPHLPLRSLRPGRQVEAPATPTSTLRPACALLCQGHRAFLLQIPENSPAPTHHPTPLHCKYPLVSFQHHSD